MKKCIEICKDCPVLKAISNTGERIILIKKPGCLFSDASTQTPENKIDSGQARMTGIQYTQ